MQILNGNNIITSILGNEERCLSFLQTRNIALPILYGRENKYKTLKTEYDEYNKSVYLNRDKLIGSQVKFTRDENHDYMKILQGFNEDTYDYLEGDERFSGCVRYWDNIPDCYVKTNIFTIYHINEQGLCSFDEDNNLCYHSLYPFEIIKGNR